MSKAYINAKEGSPLSISLYFSRLRLHEEALCVITLCGYICSTFLTFSTCSFNHCLILTMVLTESPVFDVFIAQVLFNDYLMIMIVQSRIGIRKKKRATNIPPRKCVHPLLIFSSSFTYFSFSFFPAFLLLSGVIGLAVLLKSPDVNVISAGE